MNRIIDLIFIIDLVLQFFLMYPSGDSDAGVRWVDSRKLIIRHYLTGWFALDFFSITLMSIDFVTIFSDGNQDSLGALRVLRVLRALRLVKLVRLVRASRMFKRWECKIAINYSALALGKCVIGIFVASHWFACLWALQTILFDGPVASVPVLGSSATEYENVDPLHVYEDTVYVDTWCAAAAAIASRTPAHPHTPAHNLTRPHTLVHPHTCTSVHLHTRRMGHMKYCVATGERNTQTNTVPSECIDPWALYCASLYWAVMTITSIGYGDIAATPRNAAEQVVTALLMMLGGFLWGQVIGTFCGVIATFDPHGGEFRRNMDDLNVFMTNKKLPVDMCRRLREYFHQTKHLQMSNAQNHLYRMMSPSLQGEVAWAANRRWLERIPFLTSCGADFKIELAMQLTARIFARQHVKISASERLR